MEEQNIKDMQHLYRLTQSKELFHNICNLIMMYVIWKYYSNLQEFMKFEYFIFVLFKWAFSYCTNIGDISNKSMIFKADSHWPWLCECNFKWQRLPIQAQ